MTRPRDRHVNVYLKTCLRLISARFQQFSESWPSLSNLCRRLAIMTVDTCLLSVATRASEMLSWRRTTGSGNSGSGGGRGALQRA